MFLAFTGEYFYLSYENSTLQLYRVLPWIAYVLADNSLIKATKYTLKKEFIKT
jgi:hypothetical protein